MVVDLSPLTAIGPPIMCLGLLILVPAASTDFFDAGGNAGLMDCLPGQRMAISGYPDCRKREDPGLPAGVTPDITTAEGC